MQEKAEGECQFLQRILLSEEDIFLLHGTMNKQNCRICGSQRLGSVYELTSSYSRLAGFCSISKTKVRKPQNFDYGTVTGDKYKIMWRYHFLALPNTVSIWSFNKIGLPHTITFQPDNVRTKRFQCCGRGELHWFNGLKSVLHWAIQFLLCSHLKCQVFCELFQIIPDVKIEIVKLLQVLS